MSMPGEYPPLEIKWLESKKQRRSASLDFKPKGLQDLVATAGRQKIDRWLEGAVADLQRTKQVGRAAGRQFNEVLVLTQEDLYPEAQGVIWDLRRSDEGVVVPLDFQAEIQTHLNLEYLQ